MFLNQLLDEEKKAFISLSIYAANSDGDFAEEEKVMFQEYCKEMELENISAKDIISKDEIIDIFKESEEHNKKIALFELLGLVYSDGKYMNEEKNFVEDFVRKIGLSEDIIKEQTELVVKYLNIVKEIVQVVK